MKTKLILGSFLALCGIAHSQNTAWPGTSSTSNVGIGTTGPGDKLEVVSTNNNGITITQTSYGAANLSLNNTQSGGHKYVLGSLGPANPQGSGNFSIYDNNMAIDRFFIKGSSGYVGINNTNPTSILHVSSSSSSDQGITLEQGGTGNNGIFFRRSSGGPNWSVLANGNFKIKTVSKTHVDIDSAGLVGIGQASGSYKMEMLTQNNSNPDGLKITNPASGGAPSLFLNNTTSGAGRNWSMQSANTGELYFYNMTNSIYGLTIRPSGDVGIGITSPNGKLHSSTSGNTNAVLADNYTSGPACIAVNGHANSGVFSIGLRGSGIAAQTNYGGFFEANGSSCISGVTSYGIYSRVNNPCTNDMAGLFDGNVTINGIGYLYTTAWTSDQKLKKDIKPIINGLDKIRLLKPSTYTFKTDEFKDMNLPKENQLGLIAQELEKIFPELVVNVPGHNKIDEKGEVVGTIPDHKAVNYIGLIPVLISAAQEQDKIITNQQKQLDEQKQLIDALTQKASGTTGINTLNTVETGFQMSQNEPNPFTHETVVKYILPQTINTAFMAVYDLTGKQITTFAISEKGSSSLTITSEKLAAGIYIYSIVADGKVVDSKRMIVAEK